MENYTYTADQKNKDFTAWATLLNLAIEKGLFVTSSSVVEYHGNLQRLQRMYQQSIQPTKTEKEATDE